MAVAAVTTITRSVPTKGDRMPALSGRYEGNEVRKRQLTCLSPSTIRSPSSTSRVTMPTSVQSMPTTLKTKSWRFRRAIRRATCGMSVRLPETTPQPVAEDVEEQRHQKQQQADREDGAVGGGTVGDVALADLDDEGGHGPGRLRRVEGQVGLAAGRQGHDHGLADGPGDAQDV